MLNNKDILLYSDIDNIIKLLHSVEGRSNFYR